MAAVVAAHNTHNDKHRCSLDLQGNLQYLQLFTCIFLFSTLVTVFVTNVQLKPIVHLTFNMH